MIFVSLWDEVDWDTFKADTPNAVLTSATVINYGRLIAYKVTVETAELPLGGL